jgi:hypothetical protein
MVMYGRSEEDWDQLADAGLAFLAERARLAKLTSYTELNATLERRTGLPGFDFARADDAGTGFYAFAQELGLLPRNVLASAKLDFWVRQVSALHQYYARRPGPIQTAPV